MPRRGSDLLFALLVLSALVLTVVAGLVLSGRLVSDPANSDQAAPPPPFTKPPPSQIRTQPAAPRPPKPTAARVRIAATRGDCWIVAHAGSAEGPVLIERVVQSGEQITLRARRIWLELGAAGNVDITLNGKARSIPSGTTSLVLG